MFRTPMFTKTLLWKKSFKFQAIIVAVFVVVYLLSQPWGLQKSTMFDRVKNLRHLLKIDPKIEIVIQKTVSASSNQNFFSTNNWNSHIKKLDQNSVRFWFKLPNVVTSQVTKLNNFLNKYPKFWHDRHLLLSFLKHFKANCALSGWKVKIYPVSFH